MENSVKVNIDSKTSIKITAYPKGIDSFRLLALNVNAYIYELRSGVGSEQTLPLTRENAKSICSVVRSAPSSNQIVGGA